MTDPVDQPALPGGEPVSAPTVARPGLRVVKWTVLVLLAALIAGAAYLALTELRTSRWQAASLSRIAAEVGYEVRPGPSDAIRFPTAGPFDLRNGYAMLPAWTQRLADEDFQISAQARMSPRMLELDERGLFPPFREKTQVGLELRDCRSETLFVARHPLRAYERFDALPPVLVSALLFIENRELFAPPATRNPAIEWKRLGRAALDHTLLLFDRSRSGAGGSTLATQIEKYRHSPGGRTDGIRDKLTQMASASLRSYIDGEDTTQRRRQIVLDYINTVPLSARSGFGEIIGVGDAMWAWYGRDFTQVDRLLQTADGTPPAAPLAARALAFKQVLSLVVAQRRPSWYLSSLGAGALRELTDSHLRVLAEAGVIDAALRDAALPLPLELRHDPLADSEPSFVDAKASTALRNRLLGLLGLQGVYDLDRVDLRADSSFAIDAQHQATTVLRSLRDPQAARKAGLFGPFLLNEGADTSRIAFSFTLFESDGNSNLLRVQTDNLDRPFDLNEGSRLDLGSTAKLRTLITYLEQVAALHKRWAGLDAAQLAALKIGPRDSISRWAREHLSKAGGDRSLAAMLEAAMQRSYSASPAEGFFTGGGLHYFENFEAGDNHRTMTVGEALTRSVNLVFVRLMRDSIYHVMAGSGESGADLLADPDHPKRDEYLARFADREGRVFVARFYRKYASLAPDAIEDLLFEGVRESPVPVASAFYALEPEADAAALADFLRRRLPGAVDSAEVLHAKYGPGRWPLNDRGYLASVHPLELWVAGYLRKHPGASLNDVLAVGEAARQEAYGWLFKTRHKSAQDRRIRELLEVQAFGEVQRAWARMGYPFRSLTPSYATALGASGDRPAALAEMMGIVVNHGLRLPVTRLKTLDFARHTPYETRFAHRPAPPERVLDAEVAATVRRALIDVVEEGTARRLKGAIVRSDGSPLAIGGKTGTGDHRFDTYGKRGQLVSSRVVNRSGTLVFLIGERFYGTLMAYVHEPYAADYKFTSAMPSQLLKVLAPALAPIIERESCTPAGTPARSASAAHAAASSASASVPAATSGANLR